MSKVFTNYEQQICLLEKKELCIQDTAYAKKMLRRYNYYALINGYKDIFKNPTTRTYKSGVQFEDIVNLFEFDASLRELFLKYLLRVEWEIKSLVSYRFSEKYGAEQTAYLEHAHYNYSRKNQRTIDKLIHILEKYAKGKTDYNYINHAQQVHNNVPLWIVANAMTFGNISKMYLVLPYDIQTRVSKNYPHLNEVQLGNMLSIAAQYRNVCAHGERLFSYRTKSAIPDMPLHQKLGIQKHNQQYISGKQDLFSVVIALRYLLPSDLFLRFKRELEQLIRQHTGKASCYTETEFLAYMGFPENWTSITRYKKI